MQWDTSVQLSLSLFGHIPCAAKQSRGDHMPRGMQRNFLRLKQHLQVLISKEVGWFVIAGCLTVHKDFFLFYLSPHTFPCNSYRHIWVLRQENSRAFSFQSIIQIIPTESHSNREMPITQNIHRCSAIIREEGQKMSSFDSVIFSGKCHNLPELVCLCVIQKGDQKTLEMQQPKLNLKGDIICAHFGILSIHSLF